MDVFLDVLISRINYWVYIILMMIGLYGIIAKKNLVKKIIGMNILQTAVILFFISVGAKEECHHPNNRAWTRYRPYRSIGRSLYQSTPSCADADRHRCCCCYTGCGLGPGDKDSSAVPHIGRKRDSGEDPGSMKQEVQRSGNDNQRKSKTDRHADLPDR